MKNKLLIILSGVVVILLIFSIGLVQADWKDYLGTGLISWHNLNQTTGDYTDIWNLTYNGTDGSTIRGVDGVIQKAADFIDADKSHVNITGMNDELSSTAITMNVWVKPHASDDGDIFHIRDGANNNHIQFYESTAFIFDVKADGTAANANSGVAPLQDTWQMVTGVFNETHLLIYVNGTFKAKSAQTNTLTFTSEILSLGAAVYSGAVSAPINATIDEPAIWIRALNTTEISDLYNSGNGVVLEGKTKNRVLSVTLNSPADNLSSSASSLLFNATGTPTNTNITNATLNIWYTNGTLFYNETNATLIENKVDYIFNVGNFSVGNFEWNVKMCGNEVTCTSATSNYTFNWVPFNNTGETYTDTVFETSLQTFTINISTDEDWTVSNGRLIYNNTQYSYATKTDLGDGNFQLIHIINIPIGESGFSSENRSFQWNITLTEIATGDDFSSTTTEHNQTVNEIILKLCGGSAKNAALNFTLIDEEIGDEINASAHPATFQATFEYGLDSTYLEKNYSINNLTVGVSQFDFCLNNDTLLPYVNMEAYYTAQDYTDKNYYLNNASLNGSEEEEINLYLLNESNALEFFISVEQDLSPLTSAFINVKKYFVGEGVYKTVEIDETSSDTGEFTAYLDLDKDYKYTISKNGEVLGTVTKTASCKEAPCELTISLRSALANVYSQFSAQFGQNVVYNLSWNPNTKIVTFDFIDTTGLADYFRMIIYQSKYKASETSVYDNSMYTSSGTMTANLSAYDDGDFTAEIYVSRSPEIIIDFIKFSMREFVGKFGLLGLFFAFLLVVTIIFGFSFSPSFLVLAIPLSLTITSFMGISLIGTGGLIITYVLAAIAAFAMRG